MKKIIFLLISSLLLSFILSENALKCGGNTIEHCIECDSGENSGLCAKCEEKYFFHKERKKCYACNNVYFGQTNCEGNCYYDEEEYSYALCEKEGCKKGFGNMEGLCYSCDEFFEGCSDCDLESYVCNECESNEYKLTESTYCQKCETQNCEKCHYSDDYTEVQCDQCLDGYYKSPNANGQCEECRTINIEGGYCSHICSDEDDLTNAICTCGNGYIKEGQSTCSKCPDNCDQCMYYKDKKQIICLACNHGYGLNSTKECTECGEECASCIIDDNAKKEICLSCKSGIMLPDGSCPKPLEGCMIYELDESNELKCQECDGESYILNQEKKCDKCENKIEGCETCIYNEMTKSYECLTCDSYNDYIYSINESKCTNKTNLTNCTIAYYNKENENYECYECMNDYVYVINDKTCIYYPVIDLSSGCLEAQNLGNETDPIYSCKKCKEELSIVTVDPSTGKKNCFEKEGNLIHCIKGKIDEEEKYICEECSENATITDDGICECKNGYFMKYNKFCIKCDDEKEGNPGCVAEKGCNNLSILDCNECKDGYYEYTQGQCFPCKYKIPNCEKCHYDEDENQLKCDSCNTLYSLDQENKKCIINECNEYPEISPGCIICKDKLDEFKPNNKCQDCKYGYFKTKEGSCVYCRSEKYGGSGCYECGYEEDENGKETDKIICKDCPSIEKTEDYYINSLSYVYTDRLDSTILSPDGKCYSYRYDLSDKCLQYEYDNMNNLICKICHFGYYLDSNGVCLSFIDKIEINPNCESHVFNILKLSFSYNSDFNQVIIENNLNDYSDSFSALSVYLRSTTTIKTKCMTCQPGYFINNKQECEKLDINVEQCTIQNIKEKFRNFNENSCRTLCHDDNYLSIKIKYVDNHIDYDFEDYKDIKETDDIRNLNENIDNIYSESLNILHSIDDSNTHDIISNILNISICLPQKDFEGCFEVLYIPKKKSFYCLECDTNYIFIPESGICKKNLYHTDCILENLGSETNPLYSCSSCNNDNQILISYKNGVKECYYDFNLVHFDKMCIKQETTSTKYFKSLYNCTSCAYDFIPVYSKFYESIVCKETIDEEDDKNTVTLDMIEDFPYVPANDKGICEKNYYTPDGQRCYKCDDNYIGIPGCKGECSFSLDYYNIIKCKSGCKEGYIESFEGMCQECKIVNYGCLKCHYEEGNYPSDYIGIKRERRFQCDLCEDGYVINKDGKCVSCSKLFYGCGKCSLDEKTNEIKCIQCLNKDYFFDESGRCEMCKLTSAIINGKCIKCGESIKHCDLCQSNEKGNGIICKQCIYDYILLTNNNTCYERKKYEEFEQLKFCSEFKEENGKLICLRCDKDFSLLKTEDNNFKCTYTPTLYDKNIRNYYYNIYNNGHGLNSLDFKTFFIDDYNIKNYYFFPCKESINLGTKDNPLYSCTKCYNIFENDYDYDYYDFYLGINGFDNIDNQITDIYNYFPVKIIDKTKNNIGYCMVMNHERANHCSEATYSILNGKEIYNCTKCMDNYKLLLNKSSNIYICDKYEEFTDVCHVDNCEQCEPDDSYYCRQCISSDFEINDLTGFCISKPKVVPSITWKDIYQLNLNGQKEFNGQILTGPSLKLRGITSSEINSKHSFIINLIFQLKHSLRSLQETKTITAICQIDNEVKKTEDTINIVDYECIGNTTIGENYILTDIKEVDNNENIKNAGFNKLNDIITAAKNNGEDLTLKTSPTFINVDNIIIFKIQENRKIKSSNNYTFNFSLNGVINKDISLDQNILHDAKVEMFNITDKPICTFYLEDNRNAKLNIYLELKHDTKKRTISFGNSEIQINDNYLMYSPVLNEIILNNTLAYKDTDIVEPEKKDSNPIITIIISVVAGVVVIGGVIIIIIKICIKKKITPNGPSRNNFNTNIINYNSANNNIQSAQRTIK